MSDTCTCGIICVGMTVTENRNWRHDCPEHGEGSEWYETIGRRNHVETIRRTRELREMAAERLKLEDSTGVGLRVNRRDLADD